jgi:hypothetical protein
MAAGTGLIGSGAAAAAPATGSATAAKSPGGPVTLAISSQGRTRSYLHTYRKHPACHDNTRISVTREARAVATEGC